MQFQFADTDFQRSTFCKYIQVLTCNVIRNLQARVAKETLADHLNHLFCVPDLFFDYQECLSDQQNYCRIFSSEISVGNAELEVIYVYLGPDLTPHWGFQLERTHQGEVAIVARLDFTMSGMQSCDVVCLTDANGNDVALDIHSPFWAEEARTFTAAVDTQAKP